MVFTVKGMFTIMTFTVVVFTMMGCLYSNGVYCDVFIMLDVHCDIVFTGNCGVCCDCPYCPYCHGVYRNGGIYCCGVFVILLTTVCYWLFLNWVVFTVIVFTAKCGVYCGVKCIGWLYFV